MSSLKRKFPPKEQSDWKKLREWVELRFMSAASLRGFSVSRPFGDSDRYNVAVERGGRFIRVQIKSTASSHGDRKGFICGAHGSRFGNHAHYTPEDIDVLAVYIIPLDVWYLLPPTIFSDRTSIYLRPDLKKRHRYEPYREAWHLLVEAAQTHAPEKVASARNLHKPDRRCENCFYGPNNVGDIQGVAEAGAPSLSRSLRQDGDFA